jgi:uncharacterized protein
MSLDWTTGALAAGLSCYRNQEFFETHEHWEDAWNQLTDPEKSFLQGLIQVTVAMHHYRNANRAGALSLLERALRRFERCPESFGGIDVATLLADVQAWLHALAIAAPDIPPFPRINPADRTSP